MTKKQKTHKMQKQSGRIQIGKTGAEANTLPEIGKIKIGEKRISEKTGKEYPASLDYFRATGNFANEFRKIFGEQPKQLEVAFISDDLNEVCNERFECWVGGKCWGRGDGVNFSVWNKDVAKYVDAVFDPKNPDPVIKSMQWDRTLTLRFILLRMRTILGYWSFQTKAKQTTIPQIIKPFDFVRERAGTIIGFPFTLSVDRKKSYNPGEAKNYSVVNLVPNFSDDNIELVRQYIESGNNAAKLTSKAVQDAEQLQKLIGHAPAGTIDNEGDPQS